MKYPGVKISAVFSRVRNVFIWQILENARARHPRPVKGWAVYSHAQEDYQISSANTTRVPGGGGMDNSP